MKINKNILLALGLLLPNLSYGQISIVLSDADGGIRVQMSGSTNFNGFVAPSQSNGASDAELSASSNSFFIGNQGNSGTAPAPNGLNFFEQRGSIDVIPTQIAFPIISLNNLPSGNIPSFGYDGFSVIFDGFYVNGTELAVDEVLLGASLADLGSPAVGAASIYTWNSGAEGLSVTIGASSVPEPSSALLGAAGLALLALRRRR